MAGGGKNCTNYCGTSARRDIVFIFIWYNSMEFGEGENNKASVRRLSCFATHKILVHWGRGIVWEFEVRNKPWMQKRAFLSADVAGENAKWSCHPPKKWSQLHLRDLGAWKRLESESLQKLWTCRDSRCVHRHFCAEFADYTYRGLLYSALTYLRRTQAGPGRTV